MADLKEFRRVNHLTQTAVAKYLGVSEPFISQIERGRNKLPDDKLQMLLNNEFGWNVVMLMQDDRPIDATKLRELWGRPRDVKWISGPEGQLPEPLVNILGPRKSSEIKLEKLYDENVRLKKRIEELEQQNAEYWEMIKKLTGK